MATDVTATKKQPTTQQPQQKGSPREARKARNQGTIEALNKAYTMELETVLNYLANSVNLDGVRAEEIKKALAADVTDELGHAQRIAQRIKQLGGTVPGSLSLKFSQQSLQPPQSSTDLRAVIEGVLAAENEAIDHYKQIIRDTDGEDFVTQDLVIELLGDEEAHRVLFEGFLAEYDRGS